MVAILSRKTFPIFESPTANQVAMPIFGVIGALTMLGALYDAYTEWARVNPAPTLQGARS